MLQWLHYGGMYNFSTDNKSVLVRHRKGNLINNSYYTWKAVNWTELWIVKWIWAICDQNNKVIIKYVTIFEWFRVVFMSCRTGRKCIHTPFPLNIYPQHNDSKQLPGTVKILLINNFMNIVILISSLFQIQTNSHDLLKNCRWPCVLRFCKFKV